MLSLAILEDIFDYNLKQCGLNNSVMCVDNFSILAREHEGTERNTPSPRFVMCHSH